MQVLFPAPPVAPGRRLGAAEIEERLESLFAAPVVDPGQMPARLVARVDSGEMRLALAVLEDALRRIVGHLRSEGREQRGAAREALSWMWCDDDEPPFAFVRICQLFDLDPSWIRGRVRARIALAPGGRAAVEQAA